MYFPGSGAECTGKVTPTPCTAYAVGGMGRPIPRRCVVLAVARKNCGTIIAPYLCGTLESQFFLDRPQSFEGFGQVFHIVKEDLPQLVPDLMERPA